MKIAGTGNGTGAPVGAKETVDATAKPKGSETKPQAATAPAVAAGAPGWTTKNGNVGKPLPPVFDDVTDIRYDGHLLGASKAALDPATPLSAIRGVLPDNGTPVKKKAVFINGIMTDLKLQRSDLQTLANTGLEVVGVHNATKGLIDDLVQCIGDKLSLTREKNRAIATTATLIEQSLAKKDGTEFIGHSQGAIILSEALSLVSDRLKAKGMSAADVEKAFNSLEVETLGGAARSFPPGIRPKHVVNSDDLIPLTAARGVFESQGTQIVRFGKFGTLKDVPMQSLSVIFARVVDQKVHGVALYAEQLAEKNGAK